MDGTPAFQLEDVIGHPEFQGLSLSDKNAFLLKHVPEFSGYAPKARSEFLDTVHYKGPNPNQPVPSLTSGFYEGPTGVIAPGESMGHAVGRELIAAPGRAARTVATAPLAVAKAALAPPTGPLETAASMTGGAPGLAVKRTILDPMAEEWGKAVQPGGEPHTILGGILSPKFIHGVAGSIPVLGPWVGGAISEAEKGHIGAAPQFGLEAAGFKGAGKLTGEIGKAALGKTRNLLAKKPVIDPALMNEHVGAGIQQQLGNAERALHEEVGKHAENVQKVVDERNPNGALDAKPYVKALQDGLNEYIATYTRMGVKIPSGLDKVVTEALQSPNGRWTFAQGKDVRSALYEMRAKSTDARVRGALTPAIKELTKDLRTAADAQGVVSDFDTYNDLHSKHMQMRDQVLRPVKDAVSGEKAIDVLRKNPGYVKATVLPSLERYGLETEPIKAAMDIAVEGKKLPRYWHDWLFRYGGGALGQSVGIPFPVGYVGAGLAREGLRGGPPVQDVNSPLYQRGLGIVNRRLPEGPTPVATPNPLIPQLGPPEPGAVTPPRNLSLPRYDYAPGPPQVAPAALPTATVEAAPVTPEAAPAPPSPYAATHEALLEQARGKEAVKMLSKGVKVPDSVMVWVEKATGLDMTDPTNVPKALEILKQTAKGKPAGSPRGK